MSRTPQLKVAMSPHAREIAEWLAAREGQPVARVARQFLERGLVHALDDPHLRAAWARRAQQPAAQWRDGGPDDEPPTAAELFALADAVRRTAAAAPALTSEQLDTLGTVVAGLEALAERAQAADWEALDPADEEAAAAARAVVGPGSFAAGPPEGRSW